MPSGGGSTICQDVSGGGADIGERVAQPQLVTRLGLRIQA